ncbi:MAG: OmpA family protein [Pseudomonadota bacterium]|uniref:OmpA family protein n=1 Tax=Phenylobacterium sp. TaxID=1871053 RepID=UPI0025FDB689|nr:OmpA family protein [Phenylobacterium sp.]MBT9470968.1 OmpA family protein [Phenylobacterium sp.]
MSNLVQTVINAVTPDMITKLSGLLGESSGGVGKGLAAAAPALLAAALQQSSTTSGANGLLGLLSQVTSGGNLLDQLPALLADDTARATLLNQGRGLADGLLGSNSSSIANTLASFAGLKGGSASNLLALAAPLVMGAIGKALGPSPTASGLQSLLSDQRSSILGALPPGLGALFGLGGAAQAAKGAATAAAAAGGGGLMKILPWLIAAAVVLALIFGLRSCGAKKVEAPAPVVTPPPAMAPATPAAETLTLPGGATISVAPGSIGYSVAKFLDSREAAPKTFVFDNLNFATGSNALTPESGVTVDTLVVILKAYPNVRARVVGYTDNQGDPGANKTLSENRAITVSKKIVAAGIAADRLETAGLGDADPVADNASEEGRAKNRRTELVIIRK